MLINQLIQEVQSCFKNPFSSEPSPFVKIITRLYTENAEFILNSPVSVSHGYGMAVGKTGTFKERIERFVRIISVSSDTLKSIYAVNVSEIAALLFLYDIGLAKLPIETRKSCENDTSRLEVCGKSVEMIMNVSIDEQLGTSINPFIGFITVLYKRLSSAPNLMSNLTEVIIAENIIRMDRQSIDSIKERIGAVHAI